MEPQKETKPAAKAAEPAAAEVKSGAAEADAGKAEKAAAPEKKETAVTETVPAAAAPSKVEEAKPKEEPANEKAAVPAAEDPAAEKVNVILTLQTELKRVGCYRGALDGLWGPRSDAALDAFAHYGKVKHADSKPSEAWIEHVKAKTKAVCTGNYGYARPYQGPGYRPGYRRDQGYYDRRPGYGRPPPGGYRRGGYRY